MSMDGHLVLLGAMGVGKTTVGKSLAERLGRQFSDSDAVIEARTGSSGSSIAVSEGIPYLHRLERVVLMDALARSEPMVIAAAGSVVDHRATRDELRSRTCVWLHADPETVTARTGNQTHRREITDEELHQINARQAHYRDLATVEIDTTSLTPKEAAEAVLQAIAPR